MEFSELFGAVGILRKSFELLPKNGKLMALLTLLNLALSSIFLSIFGFSSKSLLCDMLVKGSFFPISSSNSPDFISLFFLPGIKEDLGLVLIIYVVFLPAYYFISLFSTIATILLSAVSYSEQTLSIKTLLLRVLKSWIRPLYIGYCFFVLFMYSPLLIYSDVLMISDTLLLAVIILIGMVAYIFYLDSTIVWVLGMVVSVMEEDCFASEAHGKAGVLLKGKRLQGLVLNLLFNLIAIILVHGLTIIKGHKWLVNPTAIAFFTLTLSCLLKIFQLVAFTVFYFHCKKEHGEEIELQGRIDSLEYSKLSATPLVCEVLQ